MAPLSAEYELGKSRSRRLIRGIGSSVVARAATSVSPLLLIPITLRYLGDERYGTWMAITSITSMFLWADLGLGNGLLTKLTPLVSRQDWKPAQVLVSSAYGLLSVISLVGLVLAMSSYWLLPWSSLLNANERAAPSAIAVICLAAFVVNIPAALVHRVLFALQLVPQSNYIQLLGALVSLASACMAVTVGMPDLVVISTVVAGPVIANVMASLWVYRRHPMVAPSRYIVRAEALALLSIGLKFLAVGILTSLALNNDNLIVAHVASIRSVAEFSVVSRVFAAMGLLVTIINLPLWPANADALARGDHAWIRRTTARMIGISFFAVATVGFSLFAVSGPLLSALGGTLLKPTAPMIIGFATLWSVFAIASPLFMVQNSVGLLRPQLLGWSAFLGLSVPSKIAVAFVWGIEWIPLTATALYLLTVLPSAWIGFRQALAGAPAVGVARESSPPMAP